MDEFVTQQLNYTFSKYITIEQIRRVLITGNSNFEVLVKAIFNLLIN